MKLTNLFQTRDGNMRIKKYLGSLKSELPKPPIAGHGLMEDQATPVM